MMAQKHERRVVSGFVDEYPQDPPPPERKPIIGYRICVTRQYEKQFIANVFPNSGRRIDLRIHESRILVIGYDEQEQIGVVLKWSELDDIQKSQIIESNPMSIDKASRREYLANRRTPVLVEHRTQLRTRFKEVRKRNPHIPSGGRKGWYSGQKDAEYKYDPEDLITLDWV